ncbi:hypothetical protein E4U43_001401 [Claviceps pusilla]|uniref:tRNA nucleotidyltransferase n=1 Tax=Claviceps pusilla TaxID=123648 RepID=A0A9P7N9V8_9HYPO|nr:hypothetical protein E4U43_001401 [Claviceps pusilla]
MTTTSEPAAKRLKRESGASFSAVKQSIHSTTQQQPDRPSVERISTTMAAAAAAPTRTIDLLPAEQLLRELLLDCAQHFPGLQIWIAGGWVRDRLLGIPSSDLDLALSNLTGREFGLFLESFSAKPEIEAKYQQRAADLGIPDARFSRFYIVERNNDKSKKLETAGGKLFGLDIDMVNLRKEVYDGQSRTPRMEFGTPEEDTFRRDATVNALLFDLEKQEVVDLTGRGLDDLDRKMMRTPLDPRQTFMDDPLRVLRLIRIGSKLGFALDPDAMRYMRDDDIQHALDTMITRDRVNIELFKIMRSPRPEVAFQRLFEANLYTPVFIRLHSPLLSALQAPKCSCPPDGPPPPTSLSTSSSSSSSPPPPSSSWPATWPRAYRLLTFLLQDTSHLGKMVQSETNPEYLWTMAAYAPLSGLRRDMLREAVDEATIALRTPAKISKLFESALRNMDSIQDIVRHVADQSERRPRRSDVGMAIRSWGSTWTTQVTYAMLAVAVQQERQGQEEEEEEEEEGEERKEEKDHHHRQNTAANPPPGSETLIHQYSLFAKYVWDAALQDAHLQRPILDGNQVQRLFGLQRGGKFLKTALDGLVEWQFDHADCGAEEAKDWLRGRREELGIPEG